MLIKTISPPTRETILHAYYRLNHFKSILVRAMVSDDIRKQVADIKEQNYKRLQELSIPFLLFQFAFLSFTGLAICGPPAPLLWTYRMLTGYT